MTSRYSKGKNSNMQYYVKNICVAKLEYNCHWASVTHFVTGLTLEVTTGLNWAITISVKSIPVDFGITLYEKFSITSMGRNGIIEKLNHSSSRYIFIHE